MDATTIPELSDLIAQQQREINDIELLLSSQGQRIDAHDTDIGTLQDPPTGVPLPLLEWYGDGHNTREVDTLLDADLNTLTADVSVNTSDVSDLSVRLDTETADRTQGDSDLTDTTVDLQSQITDNLATLTQEIADRSALSVTVAGGLDTVNARIDDLQSDLETASTEGSTSSSSLSSQISSLSASLQVAQAQILLLQGVGVDPLGSLASQITTLTTVANDAADDVEQEILDRQAADTTLQASITTLNASVSGLNTSISDEANTREAADLDIQSDVAALTAEISGHAGLISAEEAARIAADALLQTDVDTNAADITLLQTDLTDEITNRTDADTAIQTQLDANATDIAANTSDIATNAAGIAVVEAKYGVVKDGGGYITDWWLNDESEAAGDFKLKNLNNNVRLQAVGYEGKFFPAISAISFSTAMSYDADYGGATTNDFTGTDANDYTRSVKVMATQTAALNGSCFLGVDNATGGSLQRLGQVLTTFKVDFSGTVNKYLSLWYRLKNAVGDNTQRWLPVSVATVTVPDAGTYEYVRGQGVVQISVTADKVIEFGLTVLTTFDATISDADSDFIYSGSVSVEAFNLVTVS